MHKYLCIYLTIVKFCVAQNVISRNLNQPDIACPDLFEYVCNSGPCYGKLTLPNISYGKTTIEVQFTQRIPVVSGYIGSIKNMDDQYTVLKKIGRHEPLNFRTDFPLLNELPKLTKIAIDGRVICRGSEYNSIPNQPTPTFIDHVLNLVNFSTTTDSRTVSDYFSNFPESGTLPFQTVQQLDDAYAFNSLPIGAPLRPGSIAQQDDTYRLSMPQNRASPPRSTVSEIPSPTTRPSQPGSIAKSGDPYRFNLQPSRASSFRPTESVLRGFPSIVQQDSRTWPPNRAFQTEPIAQPDDRASPSIVEETPQLSLPSRPSIRTSIGDICGQVHVKPAVVPFIAGGIELQPGQFPWLTAVFHRSIGSLKLICGGSLISMRTVLSAAHCFKVKYRSNLTADDISVSLGRYDISKSMEPTGETRDIKMLHINPEYDDDPNNFSDSDLALLIMTEFVSLTEFIKPICLWTGSDDIKDIVSKTGYVAGWGADSKSRAISAVPKMAPANIVSENECRKSSDPLKKLITSRTFCAGQQDGVGPCEGDSGGGLMIFRNGRWLLRGVVSGGLTKGFSLCDLSKFVIYCDVAKHSSWIHNTML